MSERGTPAGRCLDVTVVVDGAVHSRGGSCHQFPDPTPNGWDLEPPLRFELSGQAFIVLYGRAGADVASITTAEILPGTDPDVDDAWLVAAPAPEDGAPFEVLVEAFDPNGDPLLAERVPIAPEPANPLDLDGLLAELTLTGVDASELAQPDASASPMFTGTPLAACVGAEPVRVYEYTTIADREAESASITTEGQIQGPNNTVMVSWIGPPRFYASGRIIALTLSGDSPTADALSGVLGPTLSPEGRGPRGNGEPPCSPTDPHNQPTVGGPQLLDAPDEVNNRTPLPYCGAELQTPATANPFPSIDITDGARACYDQRATVGQPAEMIEIATTTEGDPILRIRRLLPDGPEETFTDMTRDTFGTQAWFRLLCTTTHSDANDDADCEPSQQLGP